MYACAELFCVLTNVSNKFVLRRFPLRGGSSPLSPHLPAPLNLFGVVIVKKGMIASLDYHLVFCTACKQDTYSAYDQSYTFAQPAVQTARWS